MFCFFGKKIANIVEVKAPNFVAIDQRKKTKIKNIAMCYNVFVMVGKNIKKKPTTRRTMGNFSRWLLTIKCIGKCGGAAICLKNPPRVFIEKVTLSFWLNHLSKKNKMFAL